MQIVTTGRGTQVQISKFDSRTILNLDRDGKTRCFDAIDNGVEMWDFIFRECRHMSLRGRVRKCEKEFGITWPQIKKYLKVAIAMHDPHYSKVAIKHSERGLQHLYDKMCPIINLRPYFAGTKSVPF